MIKSLIKRFFPQVYQLPPAYWTGQEVLQLPYVTPLQALSYTPVYRAVSLISNDVSRTPMTFESLELERLFEKPSQYQSKFDFMRSLTMQALLYGNAFALINRNRKGTPVELLPLSPEGVSLDLSTGSPIYRTHLYGQIPASDIIHIKASLVEGLWSPSPIGLCKTAVTIAYQQEASQLEIIKNGGNPKLAFVHPTQLNAAARQAIIDDYMKHHSGAVNAGKPMVLSENMRVERISSSVEDKGIADARKYSIEDISRIYGVPVTYLSSAAPNNYGSLEWLTRMYLDSCLQHWFSTWSSEIELKLGEAPIFDTDHIVRPSVAENFAALRTGVESGVISRNEARERLDYDPMEGLDEMIVAKNMGTGGGTTNIGNDTSGGVAIGDVA